MVATDQTPSSHNIHALRTCSWDESAVERGCSRGQKDCGLLVVSFVVNALACGSRAIFPARARPQILSPNRTGAAYHAEPAQLYRPFGVVCGAATGAVGVSPEQDRTGVPD